MDLIHSYSHTHTLKSTTVHVSPGPIVCDCEDKEEILSPQSVSWVPLRLWQQAGFWIGLLCLLGVKHTMM